LCWSAQAKATPAFAAGVIDAHGRNIEDDVTIIVPVGEFMAPTL
jgi:hypothetical protein